MNTRCLKCSINHYCTYYNQKYLIPIDLFVPNSFPYMDPILYIRPPAGIAFPLLSIIGSKIVPVPNVVDAEGRITYILVSNLKNVPFPLSLNPDPAQSIFLLSRQLFRHLLPHLQRSHPAVPRSAFSSSVDSSTNAASFSTPVLLPSSTNQSVFSIFESLSAEKAAEAKSLLVPLTSSSDRLVVHREANRSLRRRAGDAARLRGDAADAKQAAERESRR